MLPAYSEVSCFQALCNLVHDANNKFLEHLMISLLVGLVFVKEQISYVCISKNNKVKSFFIQTTPVGCILVKCLNRKRFWNRRSNHLTMKQIF